MKSNHYKNAKGEQYDFTVKVWTRPNLRGRMGEMLMCMGKQALEQMFDLCEVDTKTTSIHFEYPERWANILELRALTDRIPVVFPNIQNVTIVTHSVYIIQCVHSEHIGIYDDSSKYPEKTYANLKTRYCPPPDEMQGLFVATPNDMKLVHTHDNNPIPRHLK